MSEPPLIRLRSVAVSAGPVDLLPATSLEVGVGDRLLVVGPNGSGKTTLLRVLLGRAGATAGAVTRSPLLSVPGAVASLLGPAPLFRDLTVSDHIAMLEAAWGDRIDPGRTRRVLGALRLGAFLERFPAELSSGQRQVVGLALTLVRPARLLVLDEPEQRLDVDRRAALADLLIGLRAEGCAIVVATHDEALGRMADAREVLLR